MKNCLGERDVQNRTYVRLVQTNFPLPTAPVGIDPKIKIFRFFFQVFPIGKNCQGVLSPSRFGLVRGRDTPAPIDLRQVFQNDRRIPNLPKNTRQSIFTLHSRFVILHNPKPETLGILPMIFFLTFGSIRCIIKSEQGRTQQRTATVQVLNSTF